MTKVLRYLVCLFMLIFAGNALAAGYSCPSYKKYTSCASGYYMATSSSSTTYNGTPKAGNACRPCSDYGDYYTCAGGTSRPVKQTVTITYNLNGGSGTTPSRKTCNKGALCSLQSGATTTFYRAGYVFKGWSTSSTATSGSTSMRFTANDTVYAVWSACSAGTYKPGRGTQASASCRACTGRTKYSAAGASSCKTVSSGYYTTGCNSSGNNCTGQSQCTGATYCSGGVKNNCPAQTSGWTRNGGTRWTSYTQCNQTRAATSASTYCSAGTLKQNATSATAWGATTVSSALSAKAGAYVNGTTCSQCTANDYCPGGTAARKDCPSGYPNSAAGSDAITDCYSNTKSRPWTGSQVNGSVPTNCYSVKSWNACSRPACNYVAYANTAGTGDGTIKSGCTTNNASCEKTPAEVTAKSGYYDAGTTCPACPNGYPNSANGNEGGNTKCYISVSGGHYIGTQYSTTQSECVGGTYKAAHTVYYGSTSSCSVCKTNQYSNDGAASCTDCKTSAGYGNSGTTAASHDGVASCKVTCDAGEYVPTAGGGCVAVGSGYYKTGTMTVAQNATNTTRSACSALSGVSVSGGTYSSVSPYNASTTCRYKAPNKTITGCDTVTSATVSYSGSAWPTTTYTVSADPGYYISGSGTASATCVGCQAGYACAGGTAARDACDGQTQYQDAVKQSSCKTVSSGWYKVDNTEQAQCTGATYCSGGVKNSCPGSYTADTTAGKTSAQQCKISVAKGHHIATANSSTPADCDPGDYRAAHTVNYGSTSSCSACPSGYTSAAGTAGANTECYISVSGGHYIEDVGDNSTNWGTCAAGTYKAAHTVYYGSKSSCSACSGRTKYSAAGASSCKTVDSGYYSTGCNSSGNNCTGQSQCTGATYCASGVQNSCPAQTSGWTRNGGTGWTTYTQCNQTRAATSVSTYCSAGTLKQNATSATAWGATTVSAALSAKAGAYVNGQTCTQCQAGYKCTGGTAAREACDGSLEYQNAVGQSSCKTVSDGYYKSSNSAQAQCPADYRDGSGATNINGCKTSCAGGTYVATENAACTSVGTGYYRAAHTVNYGSTSTRSQCPANYRDGAAASAQNGCKTSCAGGTYVATENAACTSVGTGYYRAAHTVNYGSTSTRSQCPAGYRDGAAASAQNGCEMDVEAGHYVGTENSATQSTCAAGTYKAAHTVNYGSVSSCSACSGRTKYSAAGAASCKTVDTGYYTTGCNTSGNNCTGQSQCTGATYCSSGVQNSCPAQTSGWTRNGGTGWTTYTQCNQTRAATAASTYCSAGTLKQNATSATAWGATTVSAALSAKAGAYVNGTTCSQCTADNYCTGGTAAPKDCPSGYPNSDAGASAITKCYSNTKSRAWTGSQNACAKPSGCSTVTCNSCSKSACNYVAYANTAGTGDGTVKSGCSTNNESCDQTVKSVTANPGYKVNGTACAICTGATYSAGGTATSCSNCPTIYTDNTASGKKAATECQVITDGGYYIAANNDDAQTICGVRNYCPSATVNYGSHNSPIACPTASEHLRTTYPDNYYNPTSATATNQTWGDGKDAITDCKAVYTITNARGRFTVESTGYNAETEKYDVGGTKYYTKVNPGYYVKDRLASTYCNDTSNPMYYTDAQPCPAGSYCPGLSSMPSCSSGEYTETKGINSCPANYGNSPAMSDAATDCYLTTTAKNFVATPNAAQTTCTAGGYCVGGGKVNYGSTGGRTPASKGYYVSTTGATAQTPCAAGTYTSSTGQTKCTDAAAGTYTTGCQITSNNTACTGTAVCATNKYSNARASVCIECNTADGYGNSGTTAASHAGQASCKVTCGGGEYVPTAGGGCVNVGVGYWGAGGTVSETSTLARTQCESGLTTIGSGAGADEAGDCGRVLNVNGEKIYLRSTKKTTPSLNVSINGDVFYGNMGTASKGSLRLNSGGTTYSVYDDSM